MTLIKCRHCFRCYDVDADTIMIVCPACQEKVYDVDDDSEVNKILMEANYGNLIE